MNAHRLLLLTAAVALTGGCVTRRTVVVERTPAPAPAVVITEAPPPPRVEVRPPAPSPKHIWISGYWVRRGNTWAWAPGVWLQRPSPYAVWVQGRWDQTARGWVWVPGRWRE